MSRVILNIKILDLRAYRHERELVVTKKCIKNQRKDKSKGFNYDNKFSWVKRSNGRDIVRKRNMEMKNVKKKPTEKRETDPSVKIKMKCSVTDPLKGPQ